MNFSSATSFVLFLDRGFGSIDIKADDKADGEGEGVGDGIDGVDERDEQLGECVGVAYHTCGVGFAAVILDIGAGSL